jgi:hypothetical protein
MSKKIIISKRNNIPASGALKRNVMSCGQQVRKAKKMSTADVVEEVKKA